MEYRIAELAPTAPGGVSFRGGAAEFWKCHDHEVILAGPAETGKTFSVLQKLDALCWKYPGAQVVIVRKTYSTIHPTVLQTFEKKVVQLDAIHRLGGTRTDRYIYPNGSQIWLGGMDNPSKALSSERDIIYVNQAEELSLDDWEILSTRTTGRAGNMPYAQLLGDCNPGGSKHWILERSKAGKLTLITSHHRDNPALYDDAGTLTDQGIKSMGYLSSLTGVRYKRLYLGQWVTAEGAVYESFDRAVHVCATDPDRYITWGLAMDEGYTNPAVILLIGEDPDGRLHIAREFYERGKLQSEVVATAREWCDGILKREQESLEQWRDVPYFTGHAQGILTAVVDSAAAGLIADLINAGVPAEPHKGRVLDGIAAVQDLLKVQDDGKPRLTVDPSCIETINEFESYTWKPGKDEPVKEFDHALDALRYYVDNRITVGAGLVPDPFKGW